MVTTTLQYPTEFYAYTLHIHPQKLFSPFPAFILRGQEVKKPGNICLKDEKLSRSVRAKLKKHQKGETKAEEK